MKVIFNSDVLYHTYLITGGLSTTLGMLLKECAARKDTIVLPLTAKLEFDRQQAEFLDKATRELKAAYGTLEKLKINFEKTDPTKVLKAPNLVQLIQDFGIEAIVEEPTIDDYSEAHKRACLHELPHPPNSKSDEMRDLVIWIIALRIASEEGGALLISRDQVHTHARGDSEAIHAGLVRVKSAEETLEYFEVLTPAGQLIERMLMSVWKELLAAGLPLPAQPSIAGVKDARFVQGTRGPSHASCELKTKAEDGDALRASVVIHIKDGYVIKVTLDKIKHGDIPLSSPIQIQPNAAYNAQQDDYGERLDALKSILEG